MNPENAENPVTRRSLIKAAGVLAAAGPALAIEPFMRSSAKIKGLGLTTYSMKRHMKWWWGKPAKGKLDMLDFLEYCAELGIEGAEITSYFFQDPLPRSYLNEVKRRAHLLGLDLIGGAMSNNFAYKPGSPENLGHMKYFRKWLDHFADLGVPVVRVFAGKKLPPSQADEQIIANVTANLETACAYAGKRGIILGLENHDFVRNIDYLLRIIKAVKSDWLGVIWDSANLAPTPDPYKELARIAPYAVTAQVKVMTRVNGEEVRADYARLVKILRDANYRGYLVFEYEEDEDPYKAIPSHITELRKLL
jgi:sugar phosphate isomerase/epimerase